jgi:hypothetical protein
METRKNLLEMPAVQMSGHAVWTVLWDVDGARWALWHLDKEVAEESGGGDMVAYHDKLLELRRRYGRRLRIRWDIAEGVAVGWRGMPADALPHECSGGPGALLSAWLRRLCKGAPGETLAVRLCDRRVGVVVIAADNQLQMRMARQVATLADPAWQRQTEAMWSCGGGSSPACYVAYAGAQAGQLLHRLSLLHGHEPGCRHKDWSAMQQRLHGPATRRNLWAALLLNAGAVVMAGCIHSRREDGQFGYVEPPDLQEHELALMSAAERYRALREREALQRAPQLLVSRLQQSLPEELRLQQIAFHLAATRGGEPMVHIQGYITDREKFDAVLEWAKTLHERSDLRNIREWRLDPLNHIMNFSIYAELVL